MMGYSGMPGYSDSYGYDPSATHYVFDFVMFLYVVFGIAVVIVVIKALFR